MNQEHLSEFSEIWLAAYELFDKIPSERALSLSFEGLKGYAINQVSQAITAHIKDPDAGRFPPRVADVIRQIEGSSEEQATNAFQSAVKAIGQVGPYESVQFEDEAIGATIESMGGWVFFCSLTDEDLKFKLSEFSKYYRSHKKKRTRSPRMLGIVETTNKEHKDYQKWLENGKIQKTTIAIGHMNPETGLLETDADEVLGVGHDQKKLEKKD